MAIFGQPNAPQFIPRMLHHMEHICGEHYAVKEQLADPKVDRQSAKALLRRGIWYGLDYCNALRKFGYQQRLQSIIDNGTVFCGHMPKAFVPIPDEGDIPTKRKICQFTIADNVAPSVALQTIRNSVSILDCGAVRDIVFYQSLEETLGTEKFDHLFASNSPTPLTIGWADNPRFRLFNKMEAIDSTFLSPGDLCYFSNIQQYIYKHPFGASRGYNVICNEMVDMEEKPRFLGMGLPVGCYAEEVEKHFLTAFNTDPVIPENFFNKEIIFYNYNYMLPGKQEECRKFSNKYKNFTLTRGQFEMVPCRERHIGVKKERRLLLEVERPDLAKIQRLVNAPLNKVRTVFNAFESEEKKDL